MKVGGKYNWIGQPDSGRVAELEAEVERLRKALSDVLEEGDLTTDDGIAAYKRGVAALAAKGAGNAE